MKNILRSLFVFCSFGVFQMHAMDADTKASLEEEVANLKTVATKAKVVSDNWQGVLDTKANELEQLIKGFDDDNPSEFCDEIYVLADYLDAYNQGMNDAASEGDKTNARDVAIRSGIIAKNLRDLADVLYPEEEEEGEEEEVFGRTYTVA